MGITCCIENVQQVCRCPQMFYQGYQRQLEIESREYQRLNQRYQTVLLGYLGSGKTNLSKKIGDMKNGVLYEGEWIHPISVVNTPAFGAVSDRLAHSIGILAGLSVPIYRVLIVVKYDSLDRMEEQISRICLIVGKYIEIVTLIISYWDLCRSESQIANQIIMNNRFKDKYNITSIIYSQLESTTEFLCYKINLSISENKKQQDYQIEDTKFDYFFDNLDQDFEINCCKEQISQKFNQFADEVKDLIYRLPQLEPFYEIEKILHFLTIFIKQQAEDMIHKFELEKGKTMDDIYARTGSVEVAYYTHIELKKSIMGTVQQLVDLCQKRMLLSQFHPFNSIRKCPYCKQAWMIDPSCSGSVFCGEIPDKEKIIDNRLEKYQFVYEDNKITYTQIDQQAREISSKYQHGDRKIKVGCKRLIYLEIMIPLDQQIIEELIKDQFFDFLCNKQENTVSQQWIQNKKKMIEDAQEAILVE